MSFQSFQWGFVCLFVFHCQDFPEPHLTGSIFSSIGSSASAQCCYGPIWRLETFQWGYPTTTTLRFINLFLGQFLTLLHSFINFFPTAEEQQQQQQYHHRQAKVISNGSSAKVNSDNEARLGGDLEKNKGKSELEKLASDIKRTVSSVSYIQQCNLLFYMYIIFHKRGSL